MMRIRLVSIHHPVEIVSRVFRLRGREWLRAGGGSGVYKISSSDESIVKAELSQEVITLKAYKVGQAKITIVDSREESATIEITVCPLMQNDRGNGKLVPLSVILMVEIHRM